MVEILRKTPFGFVAELRQNRCYRTEEPYNLYINGGFHSTGQSQVFSVFGLAPDTDYHVELRGLSRPVSVDLRTEKPRFVLNIRDYGAAGDGVANDTAAIATALYTAPRGSVVVLPRGIYPVDQVLLQSGVDLYLEEGAVLRQNTNRGSLALLKGYQKNYDHTDVTVNASWEGHPLDCFCSLIYGKEVENVHIYGAGVLDGSGGEGGWWQEPKKKRDGGFRPRNLFLNHCRSITVSGITSRNSAAWNIHPFYSRDLKFYGLTIQSDPGSPNTDGLNPESCENVEIAGCHFQVGDDCIAIKSGKYYMSRHHYAPCRNIEIRNCWMEQGHGGVVIGSEISCGVREVTVRNCLFQGTDRGLRIKTRRGRGDTSVVDGVRFQDVEMAGVAHCFVVNMFYCCDPDGHSEYVRSKAPQLVDEMTPAIRNITVTGVDAQEISGSAVFLYGLPERQIEGVTVQDSSFSFLPDRPGACPAMMDDPVIIENLGVFIENAGDITMENNRFIGETVNRIGGKEVDM